LLTVPGSYRSCAVAFAARYAPDEDRQWIEANAKRADVEFFAYDWRVNAVR